MRWFARLNRSGLSLISTSLAMGVAAGALLAYSAVSNTQSKLAKKIDEAERVNRFSRELAQIVFDKTSKLIAYLVSDGCKDVLAEARQKTILAYGNRDPGFAQGFTVFAGTFGAGTPFTTPGFDLNEIIKADGSGYYIANSIMSMFNPIRKTWPEMAPGVSDPGFEAMKQRCADPTFGANPDFDSSSTGIYFCLRLGTNAFGTWEMYSAEFANKLDAFMEVRLDFWDVANNTAVSCQQFRDPYTSTEADNNQVRAKRQAGVMNYLLHYRPKTDISEKFKVKRGRYFGRVVNQ